MPSAWAVSWMTIRSCAFGGASRSTTIRWLGRSHQPPVPAGVASNATAYPREQTNAVAGSIKLAWLSPVRVWLGGSSGAGSQPSSGSTWQRSNTGTARKSTRPCSSSVSAAGSLLWARGHGREDPDGVFACADAVAELEPGLEAGDEAG